MGAAASAGLVTGIGCTSPRELKEAMSGLSAESRSKILAALAKVDTPDDLGVASQVNGASWAIHMNDLPMSITVEVMSMFFGQFGTVQHIHHVGLLPKEDHEDSPACASTIVVFAQESAAASAMKVLGPQTPRGIPGMEKHSERRRQLRESGAFPVRMRAKSVAAFEAPPGDEFLRGQFEYALKDFEALITSMTSAYKGELHDQVFESLQQKIKAVRDDKPSNYEPPLAGIMLDLGKHLLATEGAVKNHAFLRCWTVTMNLLSLSKLSQDHPTTFEYTCINGLLSCLDTSVGNLADAFVEEE